MCIHESTTSKKFTRPSWRIYPVIKISYLPWDPPPDQFSLIKHEKNNKIGITVISCYVCIHTSKTKEPTSQEHQFPSSRVSSRPVSLANKTKKSNKICIHWCVRTHASSQKHQLAFLQTLLQTSPTVQFKRKRIKLALHCYLQCAYVQVQSPNTLQEFTKSSWRYLPSQDQLTFSRLSSRPVPQSNKTTKRAIKLALQ